MFILLRPKTKTEKECNFRCGYLVQGEPGPELDLVNSENVIFAYEVRNNNQIQTLTAFKYNLGNYKINE